MATSDILRDTGARRPAWPSLRLRLGLVLRVIATRRALAGMDDRMLKDIGLSRADALAEADRAPWDIAPRR